MEKLAILRYSKALFALAVEKNAVDAYNDAAKSILAVLETGKDVLGIINHPAIPLEQKMSALEAAFVGKVPEDFIGLFHLLLRRGRKDEILGVLRHFDVLYMDYARKTVAKLYSPVALPSEKVAEIAAILSRKLDKTVQIESIIDDSLIAGLRVEVDGYVFDASIKHQMETLKKELLGNVY
ncbi:MAG: ATP synthase F1 subunit delta [Clostridiales bacterium]|jgi:F-type H+-transporting ATPase subunit delta|nr:ATP synthase F1 subunit delta [Clostridiales bacterium]